MSYSRGCGRGETSCASRISSSVVSPIAESTATTFAPDSRAAASRCATRFSLSVSPTDEPPNFITIRPGRAGRIADGGDRFKIGSEHLRQCRRGAKPSGNTSCVGHRRVRGDRDLASSRGRSGSARPCARTTRPTAGTSSGPGFDVGLALAFALTALAAWRRSPWVGALAATTRHAAGRRRLVRHRPREPRRGHPNGRHARPSSPSSRLRRSATGSPTEPSGSSRRPSNIARAEALHLAAAGERPAEGDLVGVLEVAADREPAREARDPNATA